MSQVVYRGPDEVEVPALDLVVAPGDVVEVKEADLEGLVHQANWELVEDKPAEPEKKTSKKAEASA